MERKLRNECIAEQAAETEMRCNALGSIAWEARQGGWGHEFANAFSVVWPDEKEWRTQVKNSRKKLKLER
jgi:hypothetical protein